MNYNIFGMFSSTAKEDTIEKEQPNPVIESIEKAAKANSEISKDYNNGGKTGYNADGETFYTTSDLVNACVNYIAETGALTEIRAGLMVDGKLTPLKDKKLKRMFSLAPNNFFTWQETLEQAIQSYLLTGNVFLSFEKLKNYEMWVLPTKDTKVVPNVNDFVDGYLFNNKVAYTTEEMVHIRRGNIYNSHYGTSALLDVLKDYLTLEGSGLSDLQSFYDNSSVGSGVLETELPLNKTQIDELRTQFTSAYSKQARHNTVILPQNIKYKSVKLSPKDSMLLDSFGIADNRVLRVFRVNSQVLGGSGTQFATNIDEVVKMVFNTAILPIVEKIIKQLELFFRVVTKKDNLVLVPDYNKLPYVSVISKNLSDSVSKLTSSGLITYNEGRLMLNMEPKIGDSFDWNFVPAYLTGSNPLVLDTWDGSTTNTQPQPQPSGSTSPTGGDSGGTGTTTNGG